MYSYIFKSGSTITNDDVWHHEDSGIQSGSIVTSVNSTSQSFLWPVTLVNLLGLERFYQNIWCFGNCCSNMVLSRIFRWIYSRLVGCFSTGFSTWIGWLSLHWQSKHLFHVRSTGDLPCPISFFPHSVPLIGAIKSTQVLLVLLNSWIINWAELVLCLQ